MKDIILDTLVDNLKIIPFLILAFFIIELLEHKVDKKSKKVIASSGKFGPLLGSILGVIPQCGFSVVATNLYITRIISLGTLIAIYLSTSDEMLPILLSENVEASIILKFIITKLIFGIFWGFLIDFALKKKKAKKEDYAICEHDECHCNSNIFISVMKHTINTFLFLIAVSFILNLVMYHKGNDAVSKLFLKSSVFSPFITSLIGLIPNCGASVAITKLFLSGAINFASAISGLLTGSGVALLVLYKSNNNFKENLKITSLLYLIGSISGVILLLLTKIHTI